MSDWTKPAALAIPEGGYFKDKVEQGRYGPIFPKTPLALIAADLVISLKSSGSKRAPRVHKHDNFANRRSSGGSIHECHLATCETRGELG
jgi:hypothetical protein